MAPPMTPSVMPTPKPPKLEVTKDASDSAMAVMPRKVRCAGCTQLSSPAATSSAPAR